MKILKDKNVTIIFFVVVFMFSYLIVYGDAHVRIKSESMNLICNMRLIPGNIYSQNIICKEDNFESFALVFETNDRSNLEPFQVRLYDSGGEIQQWDVEPDTIKSQKYFTFYLNKKIVNSKNVLFQIALETFGDKECTVAVYCDETSNTEGYFINREEQKNISLVYQLYYHGNPFNREFLYSVLVIGFTGIIVILCMKKAQTIEVQFLICFLSAAFLFLVFNTPLGFPDSFPHFCRAFEIAEGKLITGIDSNGRVGRELPFADVNLSNYIDSWNACLENRSAVLSETREFIAFNNTAVYFPLTYFPQALGIFVSKWFTNNILIIICVAKIFNLILVSFLFYKAIKITPLGKKVIFFIALIPINMQETVSLSPDSMVTALICIGISYILKIRYSHNAEILKVRELLYIYIWSICISLYKLIYLPVCLAVLLLPVERFKTKTSWQKNIVFIIFCAGISSILWLVVAKQFVVTKGIDMGMQLSYILKEPFQYYIVLCRTVLKQSLSWITMMIGSHVGPANGITVSGVIVIAYMIFLGKAILGKNETKVYLQDKTRQIICTLIFIALSGLLFTSLYLSWTAPYENEIEGIQGRYFIPMLFILYLACNKEYIGNDEKIEHDKVALAFAINACVCISLFYSYF